ncbi:MAG: DUF58 domain-containing protein [Nitrososphaeria archaeon]|nr:DUF58 domain-containing protein [Nitrososphaeria archaeon]NIN52338.1 DUF58 domain-containing protein [Nitrososphaeria archaeon]NIQ32816.1 DUF58 domain-containing protein [Nitrososphaeria archaeon]
MKITRRGLGLTYTVGILIALGLVVYSEPLIILGVAMGLFIYASKLTFEVKMVVKNKLEVRRTLSKTSLFEEECLDVDIKVLNEAPLGFSNLEIIDEHPQFFEVEDGNVHAFLRIPTGGEAAFSYSLNPVRGRYHFGGVRMILRDPYGLFFLEHHVDLKDEVRVYPSLRDAGRERSQIARGISVPLGLGHQRFKGGGMELAEIREYVYGDEFRKIEWKSTARLTKLMVKEFETDTQTSLVMVLDASKTMGVGPVGHTKLDYAARACGVLSKHRLGRGDHVGLLIHDGVDVFFVKMGKRKDQLYRILSLLGLVMPQSQGKGGLAESLENYLMDFKSQLTIIIISDLEGFKDDFVEAVRRLCALRHHVIVASLSSSPKWRTGVKRIDEVLLRLYSIGSEEKRMGIEKLRENGIPVYEVEPEGVTALLLGRVEEMWRRETHG